MSDQRFEGSDENQLRVCGLVRDGHVFASTRLAKNRWRVFVYAGEETAGDREFTKAWMQDPHFGLDS